MGTSVASEDIHAKVGNTFQAMKATESVFKQIERDAIIYHKKVKDAIEAGHAFYNTIDDVTRNASDNPGMGSVAKGFQAISSCNRNLLELQNEHLQQFGEFVILPITTNIASNQRNLQIMQSKYDKECKRYAEEVKRCKKELDKWAKKTRRGAVDGVTHSRTMAAQHQYEDSLAHLEGFRIHSFRFVVEEQRRRYIEILDGLLEVLKTLNSQGGARAKTLQHCIMLCEPVVQHVPIQPQEIPMGHMPNNHHRRKDGFGFDVMQQPFGSRPSSRSTNTTGPSPDGMRGGGGNRGFYPGMEPMPHGYQRRSPSTRTGYGFRPQQQPHHQQQMRYRGGSSKRYGGGGGGAWDSRSHGDMLVANDHMSDLDDTRSLPPGAAVPTIDLPQDSYKALHSFTGTEPGQLSLSVGDIVEIDGEPEDDWLYGRNNTNGKSGWFPASYVAYPKPPSLK